MRSYETRFVADLLVQHADARGDASLDFWKALTQTFSELKLRNSAQKCWLRSYAVRSGYIEAELTLMGPEEGRSKPIFSGYRADWNINHNPDARGLCLCGAPITLEGVSELAPGETTMVRLHPRHVPSWREVAVGRVLKMHEGAKVVGTAVVTTLQLIETP
ncbi:MAG: hypothetical protein ACE366_23625 [Bradymonadia bacterium]